MITTPSGDAHVSGAICRKVDTRKDGEEGLCPNWWVAQETQPGAKNRTRKSIGRSKCVSFCMAQIVRVRLLYKSSLLALLLFVELLEGIDDTSSVTVFFA